MRIFLSVPFTQFVNEKGKVDSAYRSDIESVINILEESGHKVYCAPKKEGWKITDHDPVTAFKRVFKEIDACDLFIAILKFDVSAGVELGMGYAFAKKKRIIIASPTGHNLGWNNHALINQENVMNMNYSFFDELAKQITNTISR
jgi:nucleoside 2-deoxyribosyltransferase